MLVSYPKSPYFYTINSPPKSAISTWLSLPPLSHTIKRGSQNRRDFFRFIKKSLESWVRVGKRIYIYIPLMMCVYISYNIDVNPSLSKKNGFHNGEQMIQLTYIGLNSNKGIRIEGDHSSMCCWKMVGGGSNMVMIMWA